jgi:hypothetical protein
LSAVALNPSSIVGRIVNGDIDKAVELWKEELATIPDQEGVKARFSSICNHAEYALNVLGKPNDSLRLFMAMASRSNKTTDPKGDHSVLQAADVIQDAKNRGQNADIVLSRLQSEIGLPRERAREILRMEGFAIDNLVDPRLAEVSQTSARGFVRAYF